MIQKEEEKSKWLILTLLIISLVSLSVSIKPLYGTIIWWFFGMYSVFPIILFLFREYCLCEIKQLVIYCGLNETKRRQKNQWLKRMIKYLKILIIGFIIGHILWIARLIS